MELKEAQLQILAQAVYELRVLLAHHLGTNDKETTAESTAAHLVYALHNDALAIIEGRPLDFNTEDAINSIRNVDKLVGSNFEKNFSSAIN